MKSFFDLVAQFQLQIDTLDSLLSGSEDETVIINGVEKSTLSKAVKDNFTAIKTMVNGRLPFKTKDEMIASGEPSESVLAEVWADNTVKNNGLYGWDNGEWVPAKLDTYIATYEMAEFSKQLSERSTASLARSNLLNFKDTKADIYPIATDSNGVVLLGIDQNGKLIADTAESTKNDLNYVLNENGEVNFTQGDTDITPFCTDSFGKVILGFDNKTGCLIGDISKAYANSVSNSLVKHKNAEGVKPIYTDAHGKVLLGFDEKTGDLIGSVKQSTPYQLTPAKALSTINQVPESDWNHFAFYGQSLSVGIQSKPALTTSAKYNTLTFEGGPKSTKEGSVGYNPGMNGYKLLVEDDLWGDLPPNGLNHGETPCSGFSDAVVQLSAKHNGVEWDSGQQLFVNTAGRGSSSIFNLLPGGTSSDGEWWLNLRNSVEQASLLAQSAGKTYSLNGVGWIQGEGNAVNSNYEAYKAALKELDGAIQDLSVSVTGQTHKVQFFCYQTFARSGQADQIPQAQLDFCNENDNAHLATPIYHLPLAHDGHFNNVGSYLVGRYFGRAYKHVAIDKVKAPYIKPISAVCEGSKVIATYEVPKPPLLIDYEGLASTKDAGFKVIDSAGSLFIKELKVLPTGNQVELTLDRAIEESAQLRYAFDYLGQGLINYAISASGNLRDSETETVTLNNVEYRLFNVAPHHKLNIIKL